MGRVWSHPVTLAVTVAAAGTIVWLTAFPRVGTDLSAGLARAGWAASYPGSAYLFSWYGGFYPAGYSLLAPYVLAAAGTRAAMAAATVASAGLFGWLLAAHAVPRKRAAAVWAAVALLTQLSAGRASFAVGLTPALGCLALASALRKPAGIPREPASTATAGASRGTAGAATPSGPGGTADAATPSGAMACASPARSSARRAWARSRWPALACLALLASLLSPVAGLFLGVPAAALLITGPRRVGLAMGVAAALPLGIIGLIPGGGVQPAGPQNWLPPLAAVLGVLWLVPARWRVVRLGALIYGLGDLAVWAVPTPVGSNIERLGLLAAGPVLVGLGRARPRPLLAGALIAAAGWLAAQPAVDLTHGNAPPYAPQTAALVAELRALHADTARVEAVPQYGHWESQELAGTVWLARGWERQLDMTRNPLFYGGGVLTAAEYYGWLRYNAVRYVAISGGVKDWAALAEAQLVRAGEPWLVPVWHDAFWRLYRVTGTLPLASPPARVVSTSPARLTLRMSRSGTTLIRVRWSSLMRSTGGTLARRGPWTALTAPHPGTYSLTAPY